MNRIWKEIDNYEGYYQISNDGLVKSLKRTIFNKKLNRWKTVNEKILAQHLSGNGYAFVCLCKNGFSKNARIHKLVIETFYGLPNEGLVVHHKDGDKLNNNLINLEYVSKQKNTQEYFKTLGKSNGEISYLDIPSIINRVNNGEEVYKIAIEYNVSRNDIAVLCKIIALTGEELIIKLK